jgi:MtN3 and saliva related transmembrane protein
MGLSKGATDAVGFAAATLTTVSFVPQLLRVWRLRSARDISLGMFLIFSAGVGLWLLYGLQQHSMPVTVANAVTLVLSLTILGMKLKFDRKAMDPEQPKDAPR